MKSVICSFILLALIPRLYAQSKTLVENWADLESTVVSAKPGDTVMLKDGIYEDVGQLNIFAGGGSEAGGMVYLIPETRGGVTFAGEVTFSISAGYIHVEGFQFFGVRSEPDKFLIPIKVQDASNVRITRCFFKDTGTLVGGLGVIRLRGDCDNNRIDHCIFENFPTQGIKIVIGDEDFLPINTRIDHNHFLDAPSVHSNGAEAVQVGQDHWLRGEKETNTIIEHNRFDRMNGEAEVISIKSSKNILRFNEFTDSRGGLWLRGGKDNEVYGNYIRGNGEGMIVFGANHKIYNNYIESCNRGINIWYGTDHDNPDLRDGGQSFHAIENSIIAFNTIVNSSDVGFYYGNNKNSSINGAASDQPPFGNTIANNLIIGNGGTLFTEVVDDTEQPTVFLSNFLQNTNGAVFGNTQEGITPKNLNMILGDDGFYRPQPGSAAIDSASDISSLLNVTDDIDGQARGSLMDVGSDELSEEEIIRKFGDAFDLEREEQVITFPTIDDVLIDNEPFVLPASSSSGLDIVYTVVSGPATVEGNLLTLTREEGTVTINASQPGNPYYYAAEDKETNFDVSFPTSTCGVQSITTSHSDTTQLGLANDDDLQTKWSVDTGNGSEWIDFQLACPTVLKNVGIAFGSGDSRTTTFDILVSTDGAQYDTLLNQKVSGGTSSEIEVFEVDPTLVKHVRIVGYGNSENNLFEISEVDFELTKSNQVITFDEIEEKTIESPDFTINVFSSSGLDVTLSIEGPATLEGNLVKLTGEEGTVTITASQEGDDTYVEAADVTRTFEVKGALAIPQLFEGKVYAGEGHLFLRDISKNELKEIRFYSLDGRIAQREKYRGQQNIRIARQGIQVAVLIGHQDEALHSLKVFSP